MSTKGIKAAVVAVMAALAGLWFAAPYWTLHQMREAAKAGDADRFNAYVDYPRLRENITTQLSGPAVDTADTTADSGREPKRSLGGIGRMLGRALATGAVQALVRPEVVMRALQYGELMPKKRDDDPAASDGSSSPSSGQGGADDSHRHNDVEWWTERSGLDQVIFYARRSDQPASRKLGLVLERRGLVSWQLTDIRIPPQ